MSYPPEASRSCHEADGRSDRSGGSGGAAGSSSGGAYGTLGCALGTVGNWLPLNPSSNDPITSTNRDRLVANWQKWSLGFDYLLQDSEGVALFKSYLQYEGCSNLLDFWFACQGFRSKVDPSDNRKIAQLIKAIYRTYIRGSTSKPVGLASAPLPALLSESQSMVPPRTEPIRLKTETRRMIAERISRKHSLDQTVFDPAQAEVEQFLRTTAYPAFLKSDVYVDFLQATLEGSARRFHFGPVIPVGSGHVDTSSANILTGLTDCSTNFLTGGKTLPTLDEDRELRSEELSGHTDPTKGIVAPTLYPYSIGYTPGFLAPQHLHCSHCSQYHLQGHQPTCRAGNLAWPVGPAVEMGPHSPVMVTSPFVVPRTFGPTAPLTMENLQMTRFYRTDLSIHHAFASSPLDAARSSQTISKENPYRRAYESGMEHPRSNLNYMYTQWVDAVRPPCSTQSTDPALLGRLPSQPPNPYHISYAPVSARDSERHSLSSEARTDDTHSHADSGHDCTATLFRQCAYTHRYPDTHMHPNRPPGSRPPPPPHHHHQQPPRDHPIEYTRQACATSGASPSGALRVSPPKPTRSGLDDTRTANIARRSANPDTSVMLADMEHQGVTEEASRTQPKHPRGVSRRGLTGWRAKTAISANDGDVVCTTAPVFTTKSGTRSHNWAEKDPPAFFKLLSEKLQRVLDNQIAVDRLDRLMTESSPNPPHSTEEPTEQSPKQLSGKQSDAVLGSTTDPATHPSSGDSQRPEPLASSLLQRPWADRLLAAARVQHANTRDNAQAILEDHCSRIWAASADRTPTSSGSGSCGVNPLMAEHSGTGSNGDRSAGPQHIDSMGATQLATSSIPHSTATHQSVPTRKKHTRTFRPRRHSPRSASHSRSQCHTDPTSTAQRSSRHLLLNDLLTGVEENVNWIEGSTDLSGSHLIEPQPTSTKYPSSLEVPVPTPGIQRECAPGTFVTHCPSTQPLPTTTQCDTIMLQQSSVSTTTAQSMSSSSYTTTTTTTTATTTTTTSTASIPTPGLPASTPHSPHSLVIGYYLGDDPVPYRSLWPSSEITLGQFKQLIPKKKGSFRYFFKKLSDEFGSGVVHQEITNDHCILPLWEGKVVAKVERIE